MRTKKGYTLMEVMVVISIMSIVTALAFNYLSFYKSYRNKILVDYCNNSIIDFINNCKQYCFYNQITGYIISDTTKETLDFFDENIRRKKLNLPKGFDLYSVDTSDVYDQIKFRSDGFTNSAGTITYKDLRGILHYITITVGTAYVDERQN